MYIPTDNAVFTIPMISGIIFFMTGIIMIKFPPKHINSFYGYRTKSSMQNKLAWTFAQKYSALEMLKLGALLTFFSLIGFFFKPDETTGKFVGVGLVILMVIILIIRVEVAIRKKFN